jgi:hypothetical protein
MPEPEVWKKTAGQLEEMSSFGFRPNESLGKRKNRNNLRQQQT